MAAARAGPQRLPSPANAYDLRSSVLFSDRKPFSSQVRRTAPRRLGGAGSGSLARALGLGPPRGPGGALALAALAPGDASAARIACVQIPPGAAVRTGEWAPSGQPAAAVGGRRTKRP